MRAFPVLTLLVLFPSLDAAFPQEAKPAARPAESLFQEAWYCETAEARLEEALEMYRDIVSRPALPATLRARALFRSGICLRKLQKSEEAKKAFERVVKEFPEIGDVVLEARREIQGETEAQASFRKKVESLIALLGNEVHDVRHDAALALVKIGPRAAPFVLAALGRGDYYTAQYGTEVLVDLAEADPSLIPALLGALRSGDQVVRQSITKALGSAGGSSWIQALRDLLGDSSPRIRVAAARALGGKDRESTDLLRNLAGDPDAAVRVAAVEALRRFSDPELLDAFTRSLKDPEESVRESALRAVYDLLKVSGSLPMDRTVLPGLLRDPSYDVREEAVRVLSVQQSVLSKGSAGSVLPGGTPGENARESLVEIARDRRAPLRLRGDAVLLLEKAGRREALPHLVRALDSEQSGVTREVIQALSRIRDPSVVPSLLEVLERSADGNVRAAAWEVLTTPSKLGGPETVKAVIERLPQLGGLAAPSLALFDWSERRDLAVEALRHYERLDREARRRSLEIIMVQASRERGLRQGLVPVLKGLEDPDPQVRLAAASAARYFPDPRVASGLIGCLDHGRDDIRLTAAFALQTVGDQRAVAPLTGLLRDRSPAVAKAASGALRLLGSRGAVAPVLGVLQEPGTPYPDHALEVLAHHATRADARAIGESLEKMRPDVRVKVIGVVAALESPEAVPFLRAQLGDEDPRVREASVLALKASGGDAVLADLAGALADTESRVRRAAAEALADFDRRKVPSQADVLPGLVDCLKDLDWETRRAAVVALRNLRDRRAIPALIEALAEGDTRPRPNPSTDSRGRPVTPRRAVTGPRRRVIQRRTKPSSIAEEATEALMEFGGRDAVPPMLRILEAPAITNPFIDPNGVFDVVGRLATPEDAPLLARSLERQKPEFRVKALQLLGKLGNRDTAGAVRAQLGEKDDGVREASVRALGSLGGPQAFQGLVESLDDPVPTIRSLAARYLGETANPRAATILVEALERETESLVLEAIVRALEAFGQPGVIPALLRTLEEDRYPHDKSGRFAVLWSLRRYPPEDAGKALESVLEGPYRDAHKKDALRVIAAIEHPRALELVTEQLESGSPAVREAAVAALGSFLDPSVLPRLVELLKDPDLKIRQRARASIDAIRYYLEQRKFARVGGEEAGAIGELTKMLGNENAAVRAAAVRALARLKAPGSLPAIVRLRKDADPTVREAVEEALDAMAAPPGPRHEP